MKYLSSNCCHPTDEDYSEVLYPTPKMYSYSKGTPRLSRLLILANKIYWHTLTDRCVYRQQEDDARNTKQLVLILTLNVKSIHIDNRFVE